jgi:uncharacterized membrane protein
MISPFPPVPPWNAAHPIVVHFPIALLMVTPIFVLLGLILRPERGRAFLLSALILMALGTAGAYVAHEAGDAAEEAAEHAGLIRPEAKATLDRHEDLAGEAVAIFTVLTLLFAALVLVPQFVARFKTPLFLRVLPAVFLLLYFAGLSVLGNTAYLGGRLVHEYGIHAGAQPVSHSH